MAWKWYWYQKGTPRISDKNSNFWDFSVVGNFGYKYLSFRSPAFGGSVENKNVNQKSVKSCYSFHLAHRKPGEIQNLNWF